LYHLTIIILLILLPHPPHILAHFTLPILIRSLPLNHRKLKFLYFNQISFRSATRTLKLFKNWGLPIAIRLFIIADVVDFNIIMIEAK